MSDLIARHAETVICENGHPICDVAQDIMRHSLGPLPEQFENWRDLSPPVRGQVVPKCPRCDAAFILSTPLGVHRLHVGGEWRP